MSGFLDLEDHPRAWALSVELCERAPFILRDGVESAQAGQYEDWPEPINLGGWKVKGLKWQGEMLPGWENFTAGRIAAISDMVLNCGYSLMMPGAMISPHVGYTSDVLRMHIGLSVPEGDCAIQVGGERRTWANGEALFFDDTVEHSAWNLTGLPRLVLLLDVKRGAL